MDYIIGVDFDNTIVSYDEVIYNVALEKGWIKPEAKKSKKEIRDTIRQLPGGEIKWQRVQAAVYGPRMGEARLIDGVRPFFEWCKRHQVRVYIVSHKTEFARRDETGTNLRMTALVWMRQNGFFDSDGMGLPEKNVYFESTRRQKVARIRELKCSHFIDDLEETFLETGFPPNVKKILYAPHKVHSSLLGVRVVSSWEEISDYFFSTRT